MKKKMEYWNQKVAILQGGSYSQMCRSIIRKMSSIAKKYSKRNGDTTIMEDHALQFFGV